MTCNECNGTGTLRCIDCNGTGTENFQCETCSGKGFIYEEEDGKYVEKPCPVCYGSGEVGKNCRTCNGKGDFVCKKCNGSGEIPDQEP